MNRFPLKQKFTLPTLYRITNGFYRYHILPSISTHPANRKPGEMLITEQNTAAQHIAGRYHKQPLAGAAGSFPNHGRKLLLRWVQRGRRRQQPGVRAERDV